MQPGVYIIQSKIKPDKSYIGSSLNISKRWKEHINDLKNNKHRNGRLQNHCNKYGIADLSFNIIYPCAIDELIKQEQYFMDMQNPYFNICKTASSCMLGRKHSDETRGKMSIAQLGHPVSNVTKEKLRKLHLGKRLSEETKQKLSIVHKNISEEARQKIRDRMIGNHHSKGNIPWNKGTKGLQVAWNKGKTGIYTEEVLNKLREAAKNRKGRPSPKKGKHYPKNKIITNNLINEVFI
jgi:group I intron endonuclease